MPITPPARRGQLYPTNLYARCYEFHPCRRCLMCQNYDPHSALCQVCEMAKPDRLHHQCSDDQQAYIAEFEERFGRPWFDVNMTPGTVEIAETATDRTNADIARGLRAKATELPPESR